MDTYTQLVAKLQAADASWESIGPQPASRLDEVEQKYGIQLPRSFRDFLIQVGGIQYPNHYFTSIDDDYLDDNDGFMCNTNMIRGQVGMPDGLIALQYDHDADQIACLDLTRMSDGECPVVWYHRFEGRVIGDCGSSFDEYIRRLVTEWTQNVG